VSTSNKISCQLIGVGAWGPGFNNWAELQLLLLDSTNQLQEFAISSPKPEIIPANERRRSPLAVRAAVEVSWQALMQSGIDVKEVACVFGSGLGDTEITDYMCRVLTTDEKQLSPTKFHNSVHNAAAGYWTISTGCMKSANSIAAYHDTVGVCLLEAMLQANHHQEPVLVTVFDIEAQSTYKQIFPCDYSFAASLLICPLEYKTPNRLAILTMTDQSSLSPIPLNNHLHQLSEQNPAAKVLSLLKAVIDPVKHSAVSLNLGGASKLNLILS
jgi:Beta-ketoacyl synthase, N-terminal domain